MRKKFPIKYFLIFTLIVFTVICATCWTCYKKGLATDCGLKIFDGGIMNFNQSEIRAEYDALVQELENKYLEKTCDVFADAKSTLLNKLKELLGEDYARLNVEINDLKAQIEKQRVEFENEPESLALKEKLGDAKEKLLTATTDEARLTAKAEMNEVLSAITKRNLANFSKLSAIKKEIDARCFTAMDIVKSKEEEYKKLEKEVLDDARNKTLELAVSYRTELEALSSAFDITDYDATIPFLQKFDPNMRLMDFDKNTFMQAFSTEKGSCDTHSCTGNCATCHVLENHEKVEDSQDKRFFKSDSDKTYND